MAIKDTKSTNVKDRQFAMVGVTTETDGSVKIRFSDVDRTAILTREGRTNIIFVTLPEPMSKADAIKFGSTAPELAEYAGLFSEQVAKKETVAKVSSQVKEKKPRAAKPKSATTLESVKGFESFTITSSVSDETEQEEVEEDETTSEFA